MAVVISEFEVVVEPPTAAEPPPSTDVRTPVEKVVLTEDELELLLERQAELAARVRAH